MNKEHDCSKCQAPEACAISARASLAFIRAICAIAKATKSLGATMRAMDALISALTSTEIKATAEIVRRITAEQSRQEGGNYG